LRSKQRIPIVFRNAGAAKAAEHSVTLESGHGSVSLQEKLLDLGIWTRVGKLAGNLPDPGNRKTRGEYIL